MFWENKDYFQSTNTCEALRTINLAINFAILAILVFHHLLMYKNALYEGQDYLYDKKSNYFFFSSKHFIQLLLEILIFAIIIPPKFLNANGLQIYKWGQGYGKSDQLISVNSLVLIWFILVRLGLITRIVTRYSKFRSFRSE